jgi:hypothetical protein
MDVCEHRYMSLKRTNVYADADDLALIKKIAARRACPRQRSSGKAFTWQP